MIFIIDYIIHEDISRRKNAGGDPAGSSKHQDEILLRATLDGPRGEREKQAWFTRHTRAQDPSERGA